MAAPHAQYVRSQTSGVFYCSSWNAHLVFCCRNLREQKRTTNPRVYGAVNDGRSTVRGENEDARHSSQKFKHVAAAQSFTISSNAR